MSLSRTRFTMVRAFLLSTSGRTLPAGGPSPPRVRATLGPPALLLLNDISAPPKRKIRWWLFFEHIFKRFIQHNSLHFPGLFQVFSKNPDLD